MQAVILSRVLEIPRNTSCMGMLMETGFLSKLLHNILHSDEKRIIKQIVRIQKEEGREGTWYTEAEEIIKKHKITMNVEEFPKSKWKSERTHKKNNGERNKIQGMTKTL